MPADKALITGVSGFVGPFLAEDLRDRGMEVAGVDVVKNRCPEFVNFSFCDVRGRECLEDALARFEPDLVFHLASLSNIPRSWEDPRLACEINLIGTINLMEAVRKFGGTSRVLVVTSAVAYGDSLAPGEPVTEDAPLRPSCPFAVTKAAQDFLAAQYHTEHGLHTVRVRPFIHGGPGQPDIFLIPWLCRQAAEVSLGLRTTVAAPPLHLRFDVTDVRDVARAYRLALVRGEPGGVYNIASGNVFSVAQLLDMLRVISGKDFPIVRKEPEGFSEMLSHHVGDGSRFADAVGWRAEVPIEKTLADTFDFWRSRLASGQRDRD